MVFAIGAAAGGERGVCAGAGCEQGRNAREADGEEKNEVQDAAHRWRIALCSCVTVISGGRHRWHAGSRTLGSRFGYAL